MGPSVYFSFPAQGHVNPTLPVVRELVRRQQRVVYYSTEKFRREIRDTGAEFRCYPAEFRMPEHGPGAFEQVSTTLEALLDLTCAVLGQTLEEVRTLRPAHVIYDSFAPWGRMVAQLLRLPTIASIPSILVNGGIVSRYGPVEPADPRLTAQWYAEFRARCLARLQRYQFPEPPSPPELLQTYGDLNLVYTSEFFQPAAGEFDRRRFQFVGPCFEFRSTAPGFPFHRLDERPLVFVSLGTVYADRPRFVRLCLEELADGPWQVVLSTGGQIPLKGLEPLPENAIVRDFVPQIEILRRSAAFITHGGMNSIQEALYHAVPLVVVPQGADQFWIAARASELGAALVLDLPRIGPGAIRASVAKILTDKHYAAAASSIGATLHKAGGYNRAADEIQSFLRSKISRS